MQLGVKVIGRRKEGKLWGVRMVEAVAEEGSRLNVGPIQ